MQNLTDKARQEIKHAKSVKDVLEWAIANIPNFKHDLVVQDEYTHDFILKIADDFYLVYDTN